MIKSLTSLRGIFILFIFFHHCLNIYPGGGTMAVAFFFVLGGFSMTLGYKDKIENNDFSYKNYIVRRCIKFYPLHWLCLVAVLPFALSGFDIQKLFVLIINATLLHSWIPIENVYISYNWVSWYLADTMFFALMFPFVCKYIFKFGKVGRILSLIILASIYILIALLLPTNRYHAILYISPYMRLFDFVFGIFLAILFFKMRGKLASWCNAGIGSFFVVSISIALLVVESCFLSEDARQIAPLYWPIVAIIILMASLSRNNGGGKTYSKTNTCAVWESLVLSYT